MQFLENNDPVMVGTVKIPRERIAILIGKNGSTKREIEKVAQVRLIIDSETGDVDVEQHGDPLKANLSLNVIQAVGRGFNPEKALGLMDENFQLIVISLREFAKPGSKRINEIKGRLIGKAGRTRSIIEDLTSTYISVYGDTVSIMGDYVSAQYSKESVLMLINGRKQRSVYTYLENKAKEIKFKRIEETFG
ncbi:MAG: KH domain-containing protein [Thermoplasmataceae archaeon]|jgi:ribosomal RNA assembly protein